MNAKELIAEYGLRPNKALGQNFLIDNDAIGRIVSLAAAPGLPILEIGPGLGALTFPLAKTGLPLRAVELDRALAEILAKDLPDNAEVICSDFLKADLAEIHSALGGGGLVAVGNLPYYITSEIASRLVMSGLPIRRMVLMTQAEAAPRFTAAPGEKNYVPLTVLSQYLFDIAEVIELGPASYYPQPEVRSKVLLFESRERLLPDNLPRLVKAAFAMRRKTLVNNLSALGVTRSKAETALTSLGLDKNVRAEALSVGEFTALSSVIME